jgi:hypothetical protein
MRQAGILTPAWTNTIGQRIILPATGSLCFVDPLADARWDQFVEQHSQASIFHTRGWIEALQRTYGYTPVVLTTSPPNAALRNGWLFCVVDSWLTGRRWVSLPFSDHCQPLFDTNSEHHEFAGAIESVLDENRIRYVETRPLESPEYASFDVPPSLLRSTSAYCFHHVDLTPDLNTLFRNCHKDSTQRKIHRAEREQLIYEEGWSPKLLDVFHGLQILTRRRHGLPPQPRKWFRNVMECVGDSAKIRIAYKGLKPIAAVLTLCHADTMVYKYGCSDAVHHNLGGMHLLLWRTITEARQNGLRRLDLGRSDLPNQGLITFKERWGSKRSTLFYSRFTLASAPRDIYRHPWDDHKERRSGIMFSRMPNAISRSLGVLLYRHLG